MHPWSCRVHFKQINSKTGAYEFIILCDQHLKQMLLSNERLLFIEPNLVVLLLSDCIARLLGFKPKFQNKYDLKNQFQNLFKTSAMSLLILFYSKWPGQFKVTTWFCVQICERCTLQKILKDLNSNSFWNHLKLIPEIANRKRKGEKN